MSDEIKKTVLNTLAEPIANSAKNITDKPSQNIGTTLADIWYLVFGGISQAAEKRKLKYSYALQEFENELKEKISKIPEDKLVEPDVQVIAPALEAAKYCVEKDSLRNMFSKIITASMNSDEYNKVHPAFINIIGSLSPLEAKILKEIYEVGHGADIPLDNENLLSSLNILECQGLIYTSLKDSKPDSKYEKSKQTAKVANDKMAIVLIQQNSRSIKIALTNLGLSFCKVCLAE